MTNGERQLRVGLIGVGGVAAKYASLYAEYPRSQLVSVYDIQPDVCRELAARSGCEMAASAQDVIDSDVEAIVISTPNALHLSQASAALAAGRHVLLQKPMTVDVDEAERLQRAADASGRVLAMYMNSLDHPLFRDIKRMIAAGTLGRIGAINCKLANGMGHVWRTAGGNFWRGSRSAVGGGSFAMLACHYLNLGQWLLESRIVRVSAVGANLMCDHIEGDDIMSAIVEFDSGPLGVVESSWCVKGEQMSLHGSTGSIAYIDNSVLTMKAEQPFEGEVVSYLTPGQRVVVEGLMPPAMGDWRNVHNQHRRFIDAVLDGGPVDVPAVAGLWDMRVLGASYRASAERRAVDVRADS
jgi:UDP-N-acetyl-2-amino-2-deoxyglucuronate dehydrogenase